MPEWWRITDAEWREFQSIPEQGYSHRYWIESRLIATRLNGAIDRIKGTQPSEQNHTNGSNVMGFGDERGDGGYRESFLSHYAADVTVPQPSEPSDEWCDHHESPGSCPVFGCLNHEPSE